MSFSDRLAGWRENLRHRWMYRRGDGSQTASGGSSTAANGSGGGFFGSLNRPGMGSMAKRAGLAILVLILLYYPIGMFIVHTVDDDIEFTPSAADKAEGGSMAVAFAAGLIDREVNQNSWTANDPFFQPGTLLDNMPNFQQGIMSALARFGFELTDQLGRTRGSSEADPDLQRAAGLLQYPGNVWIWNPSVSLAPRASSESQYRDARTRLLAYNARLAKGEANYDIRADNLLATIERFAADIGSSSALIDRHLAERAGSFFDSDADDIFYFTKGKLYGYYMVLQGLGADFAPIIKERNLEKPWNEMMESFRKAALLDPWVVSNGELDAQFQPNHLAAQGFYLLRARTQLREISNILLK
ncbi:DUF2333 family protein [Parvibaculum sp.]|uniref:DUF2333 family protein n=1 Tax=Parvibaculum sp. TaxID=2024848 RepID=UPI001B075A75|nr:DUF2333 family protein [Parvibaculum sp.]MBO6668339.1 DUF2333 family protein [Parvibaculum sp.]MBO6693113.1 DUF2333 family protein [Parvibaculum sp.]MBO6714543.1 DUF2333 family protein [Parvibaculum sp.]